MRALEYDVVCVGAGGAGVTAATTAAKAGARVLLLSKEPIGYGNTRISMGAVASCGAIPEDTPEVLFNDLLVGGEHLNNPKLARVMAEEAMLAPAIAEGQGQLFNRDGAGGISRGVVSRAAGHRFRRTVRNPAKGVAIGQALRAAVARAGVDVVEDVIVVRLLTFGGRISGLIGWNVATGQPVVVRASAVVLAAGGLGWLYYPHTDCVRAATGDGYALAYEAGADLVDMEQVQFLPFACTHPSAMVGIFLGEPAWAGPHGRLLDGRGRELLAGLSRMTRAQVSRVMGIALLTGDVTPHGGLLLDLRPNLATPEGRVAWQSAKNDGLLQIAKRAYGPKAYEWLEPWDVAPTAHFHMGGVRIDERAASSVKGLFAAGEVAGGVHGANRLGSVALAELFVFGRRAGDEAARYARGIDGPAFDGDEAAATIAEVEATLGAVGHHRPITLVRELQRLMWEKVGVIRDETGLRAATIALSLLREQSRDMRVDGARRHNQELLDALELRLMLFTAEMVVGAALHRRESRGAHVRLDHPERDDARWLVNIVTSRQATGMGLRVEPTDM